MKTLNGKEIAGFVKARQAKQVRGLLQNAGTEPKLAIIQIVEDPVIDLYVRLKRQYGADILIDVEVFNISQDEVVETINRLNNDDSVHGIIVQLPVADESATEEILNLVAPEKDVDGLGENSEFDPATPMAIRWLLDGFNVDLLGKKIAIIGKGRLVGGPLFEEFKHQELDVRVFDESTDDIDEKMLEADIVISATGQAGLVQSKNLNPGVVAVDAGVAVVNGKTSGDFADDVHSREDIIKTPRMGGVGPLTVCALFENVIRAATKSSQ